MSPGGLTGYGERFFRECAAEHGHLITDAEVNGWTEGSIYPDGWVERLVSTRRVVLDLLDSILDECFFSDLGTLAERVSALVAELHGEQSEAPTLETT